MGWKKIRSFLLGCCGGGKNGNQEEEVDDVRRTNNQGPVVQQIPGIRGYIHVCPNGDVVMLRHRPKSTRGISDHVYDEVASLPGSFSGSTTDADMVEANRQIFEENFGARMLADALAEDKSTSGSSSDCASGGAKMVVGAVSEHLPPLPPSSDDDTIIVESSSEYKNNQTFQLSTDEMPKLVATRKRKVPDGDGPWNAKASKAAVDYMEGLVVNPSTSEDEEGNDSSEKSHGTIPSLADNPDAFWKLLRALSDQLGPLLNPSGPMVTRPHDWEKDGCICRFLFPPGCKATDGGPTYKVQTVGSKPEFPAATEDPFSPRVIMSPMRGYTASNEGSE